MYSFIFPAFALIPNSDGLKSLALGQNNLTYIFYIFVILQELYSFEFLQGLYFNFTYYYSSIKTLLDSSEFKLQLTQ